MFITFEGPDGSGKTTALKKVIKWLTELNVNFVLTREPGGTKSLEAEKIRKILLNKTSKLSDMSELLLYSTARRLNLETIIWPALKKNQLVICDRYIDSSFAYQGFGRELGFERVKLLQDLITDNTYPDLTIFFDLPPQEGVKRIKNRKNDRLELTSSDFKQKVYEGYKSLSTLFSQRFVVVNALQSKEAVFNQVKNIIMSKIIDSKGVILHDKTGTFKAK